MNRRSLFLLLGLLIADLSADWGNIGNQIESAGESVASFGKQIAAGFTGSVPSAYTYSFRVFNGSTISMQVNVNKKISVMGARFGQGDGDSQTLAPGQDSGTTFGKEHLYFLLGINETSGGSTVYTDPQYTLGAKNDPTVYYYHCYNDASSGSPAAEKLGAGYTTSSDFSGRIQNNSTSPVALTYTITNGSQTCAITLPDIDPGSFNFLTIPQGFSIRPSNLVFAGSKSVVIPAQGIAQVIDAKTTGTGTPQSTPVTMNYVYNASGDAFETGIGPGNFLQPSQSNQIRDISPIQCQIYNQPAAQAASIGQLLAQDLPWQSVWCVYQGLGWSSQQNKVVSTPMWQVPVGASASCFLFRPSIASLASAASNGPAYFVTVRLNIPEKPSAQDISNAQTFLSKLITGRLSVNGLSTAQQGGTLITQANSNSITLTNGLFFPTQTSCPLWSPYVAYPPLAKTYLGSSITLSSLTIAKKAELLSLDLPDEVGVLLDPTTGVKGVILTSDVFTSYGIGSGPFYYLLSPCYVDMSLMLGTLSNYAALCNYKGLTPAIFNQLIQSFLPQTLEAWITSSVGNPTAVRESIASFLVLLGKGDITALTNAFTGSSSMYVNATAQAQLSPQGNALLKMLLYGPCSMSQLPTYFKGGSVFMSPQSGWPAITLNL